mgnify:CR=1 FL=1
MRHAPQREHHARREDVVPPPLAGRVRREALIEPPGRQPAHRLGEREVRQLVPEGDTRVAGPRRSALPLHDDPPHLGERDGRAPLGFALMGQDDVLEPLEERRLEPDLRAVLADEEGATGKTKKLTTPNPRLLLPGTENVPGLVNVDFADVRTVMSEQGKAMMGIGEASGLDRARLAAEQLHLHVPARVELELVRPGVRFIEVHQRALKVLVSTGIRLEALLPGDVATRPRVSSA